LGCQCLICRSKKFVLAELKTVAGSAIISLFLPIGQLAEEKQSFRISQGVSNRVTEKPDNSFGRPFTLLEFCAIQLVSPTVPLQLKAAEITVVGRSASEVWLNQAVVQSLNNNMNKAIFRSFDNS
jgi:hypothetical protein